MKAMKQGKPLSLNEFQRLRSSYLSDQQKYQQADKSQRQRLTDVFWRSKIPFRMYGRGNQAFEDAECALLKGMLVETKMDHYAVPIREALEDILHTLAAESDVCVDDATIIDPFAGSGNLLYHVAQMRLPSGRCPVAYGWELDRRVFKVTSLNFEQCEVLRAVDDAPAAEGGIVLRNGDSLAAPPLPIPDGHMVVVLVDPPWKSAWCSEWSPEDMSLDHTDPPVADIIAIFKAKYPRHAAANRLMFVVPFPKRTTEASVSRLVLERHLHPLSFREAIPRDRDFGQELLVGLAVGNDDDDDVEGVP